ncbi:hypothetical protein CaCOL14_008410 [Colletotrichum acutatum]
MRSIEPPRHGTRDAISPTKIRRQHAINVQTLQKLDGRNLAKDDGGFNQPVVGSTIRPTLPRGSGSGAHRRRRRTRVGVTRYKGPIVCSSANISPIPFKRSSPEEIRFEGLDSCGGINCWSASKKAFYEAFDRRDTKSIYGRFQLDISMR